MTFRKFLLVVIIIVALVGTMLMMGSLAGWSRVDAGWRTAKYAPWYGPGFYGKRTACGHKMSRHLRGIAHRTLPCGTKVVLRKNGYRVVTKVVDRGPYPAPYLYQHMPFDMTARTNCWDLNGGKYEQPCPSRRDVKWKIKR